MWPHFSSFRLFATAKWLAVSCLVWGLLTGCEVNERLPDGGQLNVGGRLLLRLQNPTARDWATLLSSQVTLTTADKVERGRDAVAVELAQLKVATAPELHHELARVTLSDGRLLFVQGAQEVTSMVLFPRELNADQSQSITRYHEAWRRVDSAERERELVPAWAKQGRYVDPGNDVTGLKGLSDTISEFHRSIPGAVLKAPQKVSAVAAGWVLSDWRIEAEASPPINGFDVIHSDESGLIDFVCGFYSPRNP